MPLFLSLQLRLQDVDNQERVAFLKRVQLAHSGDYWVNVTLAGILLATDEKLDAIRFYQAAVSIRPEEVHTYRKLAWALWTVRAEGAIEASLKAEQLAPMDEESYRLTGIVFSGLGRYDEAHRPSRNRVFE